MRLVFLGTPAFAVPTFEACVAAGHEVLCAVTQPDRPSGRGQKLSPPPVKEAAERLGVVVRFYPAGRRRDAQGVRSVLVVRAERPLRDDQRRAVTRRRQRDRVTGSRRRERAEHRGLADAAPAEQDGERTRTSVVLGERDRDVPERRQLGETERR